MVTHITIFLLHMLISIFNCFEKSQLQCEVVTFLNHWDNHYIRNRIFMKLLHSFYRILENYGEP